MKLYLYQTELFNIELFWHLTVCKQNIYLYETELFEVELIESGLALNNLQRLICHKTQLTNQPKTKLTNQPTQPKKRSGVAIALTKVSIVWIQTKNSVSTQWESSSLPVACLFSFLNVTALDAPK